MDKYSIKCGVYVAACVVLIKGKSLLLSDCSKSRDNNFNLLRFIAASLVLYSHSFAIQIGDPAAEPLRNTIGMTWGTIAVDIFFITSGFLIAGSFFNRKSLLAFTWARVLRIFPGLLIANLITVFVIGLIFTQLPLFDYLKELSVYKFLVKNTLLLVSNIQWVLPGVFIDNPLAGAVNGSLWTLPYEVKMYMLLAIAALVSLWVQNKIQKPITKLIFVLLVVATLAIKAYNFYLDEALLGKNFIRLFSFFFIGSLFYLYSDKILLSTKLAAFLFVLLMFCAVDQSFFVPAYTIALPYLIFYIAYVPAGKVRLYNRFGDYSYGMYVYAYPVQQAVIAAYPSASLVEMIVYPFALTLVLAYFSWHIVEKKALALKNVNPWQLFSQRS